MSRFAETETAVIARLRVLKAKPEVSINRTDLIVPLQAAGFSVDEIKAVLNALEQDGILSFGTADRLLILKPLPECCLRTTCSKQPIGVLSPSRYSEASSRSRCLR